MKKIRKGLVITIILILIVVGINSSFGRNSEINYNQFTLKIHSNFAITDELLAFWPFDEGYGNIAHDVSGNGYDGIIHGATWCGFALCFDE